MTVAESAPPISEDIPQDINEQDLLGEVPELPADTQAEAQQQDEKVKFIKALGLTAIQGGDPENFGRKPNTPAPRNLRQRRATKKVERAVVEVAKGKLISSKYGGKNIGPADRRKTKELRKAEVAKLKQQLASGEITLVQFNEAKFRANRKIVKKEAAFLVGVREKAVKAQKKLDKVSDKAFGQETAASLRAEQLLKEQARAEERRLSKVEVRQPVIEQQTEPIDVLDPQRVINLRKQLNAAVKAKNQQHQDANRGRSLNQAQRQELLQELTSLALPEYLGIDPSEMSDETVIPKDILEELNDMLNMEWGELVALRDWAEQNPRSTPAPTTTEVTPAQTTPVVETTTLSIETGYEEVFAEANVKALAQEIRDSISDEAHSRKVARGVVKLPDDEFKEISKEKREAAISRRLGADASAEVIRKLAEAEHAMAIKLGFIKTPGTPQANTN